MSCAHITFKIPDILGHEMLKLLLPKDGFVTVDYYPIHACLMASEGNYTMRGKNVIDE